MKNLTINYKVFTDKINTKHIILLSDLHDCTNKKKINLIDDIISKYPDLIIIAGDILKSQKYTKGSLSQANLKDFLKIISENAPVVLGLGNHDIYKATEETFIGYKDLENARVGRVFPLSNESIAFNGMNITEFHPSHSAFAPSNQENGNALLQFCDEYIESNLEVLKNNNLFNILICHNPKLFAQARSISEQLDLDFHQDVLTELNEISNKLGNYDLVVSGHLHNGYIPLSKVVKNPSKYIDNGYWEMPIERNMNGEISKIRPWVYKKTDMCRGTVYVGLVKEKIIQLCDGTYYLKKDKISKPFEVNEEYALNMINRHNMTPIVISGGVNRYFGLPVDKAEITQVKVLKKK